VGEIWSPIALAIGLRINHLIFGLTNRFNPLLNFSHIQDSGFLYIRIKIQNLLGVKNPKGLILLEGNICPL
jgi:hypothetical protein